MGTLQQDIYGFFGPDLGDLVMLVFYVGGFALLIAVFLGISKLSDWF